MGTNTKTCENPSDECMRRAKEQHAAALSDMDSYHRGFQDGRADMAREILLKHDGKAYVRKSLIDVMREARVEYGKCDGRGTGPGEILGK